MKRVLSLGAGVQSSVVLLMADAGTIEPIDLALFADTQWEPEAVYQHLDWLEQQVSTPVVRVSMGRSLRDDTIANVNVSGRKGYSMIPFYRIDASGHPATTRRQCTSNYKIRPMRREITARYGREHIEQLMGISYDEAHRMRDSDYKSVTNSYPPR